MGHAWEGELGCAIREPPGNAVLSGSLRVRVVFWVFEAMVTGYGASRHHVAGVATPKGPFHREVLRSQLTSNGYVGSNRLVIGGGYNRSYERGRALRRIAAVGHNAVSAFCTSSRVLMVDRRSFWVACWAGVRSQDGRHWRALRGRTRK